jgi:class 3 adenylate cyclase
MGSAGDLKSSIATTLSATWDMRDGTVVPRTDDVKLANGAVKLTATFLYADLVHSTTLAQVFDRRVAAKIVRCFLSSVTRLIKERGGEVRSFDGDRVMGVFVGKAKNTSAALCALNIAYVVEKLLRPMAEEEYPSLKAKGFVIRHCAGVHSGEALVVRGGVRGDNDLVFIGSPPNLAAKLSEVRRTGAYSYITQSVHDHMHESARLSKDKSQSRWTRETRQLNGVNLTCYRSGWWVRP